MPPKTPISPEKLLSLTRKLIATDPDTTITQLQCLLEVYLNPGELRVSDISVRCGVTSPSTTRCVDLYSDIGFKKKEGKGWLKRIPDPEDRRFKLITMTAKGTRFIDGLLS